MPFLVHGEVTDHDVDVFDREAVFIERIFSRITADFPGLRTVFEHITTADAADFVASAGPNVAATITPQHLHISRNDMLVGGIRPHAYCLPVAKREKHRLALRAAALGASRGFRTPGRDAGKGGDRPQRPRANHQPALLCERRIAGAGLVRLVA